MITVTMLDEARKLRSFSLLSFPTSTFFLYLRPTYFFPQLFFQATSVFSLQSEIIFLGNAFGHKPGYEIFHRILLKKNNLFHLLRFIFHISRLSSAQQIFWPVI